MTPWLQDPDVTLYHGDVLSVLPELPAESVDCVVTSPPYWGLRDYGKEGQLGLEPTPEQYVERMVEVFREVRRVLAGHGTVWLNLGDSYAGSWGNQGRKPERGTQRPVNGPMLQRLHAPDCDMDEDCTCVYPDRGSHTGSWVNDHPSLKPKDLVGIPWRVAFALQAEGWYLRSDIIWAKPNPMPESVTDRPTKAHEYVFLLSKQPRYFFDQEAVREAAEWARWGDQTVPKHGGTDTGAGWIKGRSKHELQRPQARRAMELFEQAGLTDDHLEAIRAVGITDTGKATVTQNGTGHNTEDMQRLAQEAKDALGGYYREFLIPNGRNIRSVWEIATQPYPEAHFATFPEELARRAIAAGCPEQVCRVCGKAREQVVEVESSWRSRSENGAIRGNLAPEGLVGAGTQRAVHGAGVSHDLDSRRREVLGFTDCGHADYRPGIVLDPFGGSGTTALVARKLGRKAVLIELNADYCEMASRRLAQQSLLTEIA